MARFRGELKELPSSCGGSLAVSLTVRRSGSSSGNSGGEAGAVAEPRGRFRPGLTKVRVVPLVEEQLVADPLHDDVPGVDRARAAHQRGQDGVGGEHVSLSLRQLRRRRVLPSPWRRPADRGERLTNLADDGVVGGGDGVEDPFDAFQLLLVACGDPVKSLVVVLKSAAALAAGNRKSARHILRDASKQRRVVRLTCPWGRPPPYISSSSAWGSPSPPSPPTHSSPPLRSLWASAEPAGKRGGARSHGATATTPYRSSSVVLVKLGFQILFPEPSDGRLNG